MTRRPGGFVSRCERAAAKSPVFRERLLMGLFAILYAVPSTGWALAGHHTHGSLTYYFWTPHGPGALEIWTRQLRHIWAFVLILTLTVAASAAFAWWIAPGEDRMERLELMGDHS